jgi:catechol 2,3-dioxygenase-like lactoylglutathione lyase family enzyme
MGRTHLKRTAAAPGDETPAFFDHVDFRVRDLRKVRAFYDAFMKALGFAKISGGTRSREYAQAERRMPFFVVDQAARSTPGLARIAFGAASRAAVDKVAKAVRRAGARAIEGPEVCRGYSQPYYAVFFEDPDGNRFEVCCRR